MNQLKRKYTNIQTVKLLAELEKRGIDPAEFLGTVKQRSTWATASLPLTTEEKTALKAALGKPERKEILSLFADLNPSHKYSGTGLIYHAGHLLIRGLINRQIKIL